MSKIKLTGSNSGYVEISSAADAGNLTLQLPTAGTALLSNAGNVFSGITTTGQLDINGSIDVSSTSVFNDDLTLTGASYDVVWDKSDNQLEFGDNAKLSFGTSSDFQLYHLASDNNSYIKETGSGSLMIQGDVVNIGSPTSGEYYIRAFENADVQIRYNNSTKIQTTNTGAVVTGICTATSFSGSGEGLTRTTQLSHRNVVINGGMQIAQRGTTSTGNTVGGYKTCDRWELALTSAGTWTVTRSGTCPDGFNHSIKLDCTTANTSLSATSFLSIRTAFEGQDLRRFAKGTSGAKAIAVSFYVKTNKNGTYVVELYDVDNTKIASQLYTVSNSNWNRYEVTFPASTNTGEFNNDNGKSLSLSFILAAGTNYTNGTHYGFFVQGSNLNRAAGLTVNLADSTSNDFYLTGVQMEEGEIATPFEHRSFNDELTRCLRYYWKDKATDANHVFAVGANYTTSNSYARIEWPVPMRGTDSGITIGYSALSDFKILGNNVTINGLNATSLQLSNRVNQYGGQLYFNGGGQLQQGGACHLRALNTNAYISYDCEL